MQLYNISKINSDQFKYRYVFGKILKTISNKRHCLWTSTGFCYVVLTKSWLTTFKDDLSYFKLALEIFAIFQLTENDFKSNLEMFQITLLYRPTGDAWNRFVIMTLTRCQKKTVLSKVLLKSPAVHFFIKHRGFGHFIIFSPFQTIFTRS